MRYFFIFVFFCLCVSSCKTQKEIEYITIEKVRTQTDTLRIASSDTIKDSIVITYTDSVKFVDRWHTKIVTRTEKEKSIKIDTMMQYKYITKIEYKDKPMKWWQKGMVSLGCIFLIFLIFILLLHLKR